MAGVPAQRKRDGAVGRRWLVVAGIVLATAEAVARLVTTVNPQTGVLQVGRVALLPYVVDRAAAKRGWDQAATSTYIVRDEQLGWTLRPNGEAGLYAANADGLRGRVGEHVDPALPPDRFRLSVYGDSFTHGDGVALDDTWPEQIQRLEPRLQVLNFGVPAYGTDQAFLRFRRDGRRFEANAHVLCIWPEDVVRNINVVRFYLVPTGEIGTSKPRFVLSPTGLELFNSPVLPEESFLGTVSGERVASAERVDRWYREAEQRFPAWYHVQAARIGASLVNAYRRRELRRRMYLDEEGEALRVTVAIATQFARAVAAGGSRAIVAILPMRDLLDEQSSGEFPLAEMIRAGGVEVIDLGEPFARRALEAGVDTMFFADGHLTPAGNRVVAEILAPTFP